MMVSNVFLSINLTGLTYASGKSKGKSQKNREVTHDLCLWDCDARLCPATRYIRRLLFAIATVLILLIGNRFLIGLGLLCLLHHIHQHLAHSLHLLVQHHPPAVSEPLQ